jgi:hypothetical protein
MTLVFHAEGKVEVPSRPLKREMMAWRMERLPCRAIFHTPEETSS